MPRLHVRKPLLLSLHEQLATESSPSALLNIRYIANDLRPSMRRSSMPISRAAAGGGRWSTIQRCAFRRNMDVGRIRGFHATDLVGVGGLVGHVHI